MPRTKTKETAMDRWIANYDAIGAMLERIQDLHENMYDTDPETLNWGNVGDIAQTHEDLKKITDRLFREGEYKE